MAAHPLGKSPDRQRTRIVDVLLIAAIGLAIQAVTAVRIQNPTYMDAYYYATNGRRLHDGFGFTERVIWQFLDEPEGIPTPSHTYWMPFPSLLVAAGLRLNDQFRGMQLPFWLLAGLLPLLSYFISLNLTDRRGRAWTAALLAASGGFYVNFFPQPSTFAPFAWAGGLCILALAQAGRKQETSLLWWLLAGLTAGVGHLTRADGALLLLVGILVWVVGSWRANANGSGPPSRIVRAQRYGLIWMVAAYLLIMGGWYAHNMSILGRPLSTVGTQTIFLQTYDDLFAYGRDFGLPDLLDWGWDNILRSRLTGVWIAVQTFITVGCLIFLAPFVLWGWLRFMSSHRTRQRLRPLTWYAIALFLTMSIIFTYPGGRGGLFHSSAALWPWFMALAAAGIDFAVDWFAARLPHWQPERAKRIFSGLFVATAVVVSFAVSIVRAPDTDETRIYRAMGQQLPGSAVVMVGNAPGFYYHTGLSAVSVPNEPVEVLLQAAGRYQTTHLVLDEDRPQPLDALYRDQIRSNRIRLVGEWDDYRLYELYLDE